MKEKLRRSLVKIAYKNPDLRGRVLRMIRRADYDNKKRMIIMLGPPASGKGFFLERGGEPGLGLPESTQGLFDKSHIPQKEDDRAVEESDANLRFIQRQETTAHYKKLKKAHSKGKKEFNKVLDDLWYKTKDGDKRYIRDIFDYDSFQNHDYEGLFVQMTKDFFRRAPKGFNAKKAFKELSKAYKKGADAYNEAASKYEYLLGKGNNQRLSKVVSFNNFVLDNPQKYYQTKGNSFYVSMRGWHNDVDKINPDTGKPVERYKDQARIYFEKNVNERISSGKDFIIADSAGEDIDVQDFEGQIREAKAAGYEVTVIALDIPLEDTALSNMNRGFVFGNRMVDREDIDNYYEKSKAAIEKIKKANPDNFLHYKRPPLSAKERKRLLKLFTETPDGKPTFLKDPSSKIRTINDIDPPDAISKIKSEILGTLYNPEKDYVLSKETSFSSSFEGFPSNPFLSKSESRPKTPETNKRKSPDRKEKPEKKWLDERVKNPETGNMVKIRTLKNKPRDSEGHRLYQHLLEERQKRQARRIASYYFQRRFGMPMDGNPRDWTRIMAQALAREFKEIEGYPTSIEEGAGNKIFITLEGAEGDVTTARKARALIDPFFRNYLNTKFQGTFDHTSTSYNRHEDLIITITLDVPGFR